MGGSLNREERAALEKQLWISKAASVSLPSKDMNLRLDAIDHIILSIDNDKDDPASFALTFAKSNRSN